MALYPLPKIYSSDFKNPLKKPIGNVKVNWSHPIVSNADSVLLFNKRTIVPFDETNSKWEEDTTNGATPYAYEIIDKNLAFARQDIDNAGICYKSPLTIDTTMTTPLYTLMVYTLLRAPTGASQGVYQIADSVRDGTPVTLLNSRSTTTLGFFADGDFRFVDIPIKVGKRHVLLYRFDGDNTHDFFDSAKGVWETHSGGGVVRTGIRHWIGTGFQRELPAAFELFVSGVGKVPSLAACREIVRNPYDFLEPKTPPIYFTADVTGISITATLGNINYSSQNVTVQLAGVVDVTATLGAISYSSQNTIVQLSGEIDVNTTLGAINYASQNSVVQLSGEIVTNATLGQINYTSNNTVIELSGDINLSATLGQINYSSQNATVTIQGEINVQVTLGQITYDSNPVIVQVGVGQVIGVVTVGFADDLFTSEFKPDDISTQFKPDSITVTFKS